MSGAERCGQGDGHVCISRGAPVPQGQKGGGCGRSGVSNSERGWGGRRENRGPGDRGRGLGLPSDACEGSGAERIRGPTCMAMDPSGCCLENSSWQGRRR